MRLISMSDFDTFHKYFAPKGYKTGYLATIAGRGRPTLRPVTFFLSGAYLCFCTTTEDAKVKQIKKNPRVEVCIPVNRGRWRGYYRLTGEAELVTERAARKKIAKLFAPTEKHWGGYQDPRLTIIKIKPATSRYLPPGKPGELDVPL